MGKAGAASDLISLPQGGGAIKGLGEKFSPDLHTGTGNFSIPLSLPPGRNGFQPSLTLGYSTGGGNGAFGLGWSLGVPGVSRLTSKGIPRYRDDAATDADIFVLSGAEDLVPVETGGEFVRYQPRTEGLFARITHHRSVSTNHWEVRSKDGLISYYGTPGARRADPAVNFDPATPDQARIFAWRLTATVDPFGNRIEYEYERDQAVDGAHHFDQLYVKRIRYADYDDAGGRRQFLVSVVFDYDDRPDPFSEYRAGFELRTRKRCTGVKVCSHPGGQETRIRTYQLRYLDELAAAADLPPNGLSLLAEVDVIGHDDAGQAQEELPPLSFGYSRFAPQSRKFMALEGRGLPATALIDPDLELIDLFGNGLPDIVELGETVRYWRNLGHGRFDLPRPFSEAPASWRLSNAGVQILDANGDGRADLLVTDSDFAGYYPLDFRGGFSRKSFQRYQQAPSFNLEDPEVRLVDLTGDGVSDALRSGTSFECYFNHPQDGWLAENTQRMQRQRLEAFPDVSFSDPRVKLADISGDGLQDIALVHARRVDYWPNLGYGQWGRRITMTLPVGLPFEYDPQRVLLGDVDGDGLADLLYVSDREVTLWINRYGNGWSEPITIRNTPAVNSMVSLRLVDLLGNGVGGLLWTREGDGSGKPQHFFLDFTGGSKPYLLDRMDNNLGAVTEVSYASSTKYSVRDDAQAATRWHSTLPFPVQVVERVKVHDELSGGTLSTEYRYHHGYWDGVEREFRGFGMVEQLDTEVFDSYAGRAVTGRGDHLARLLQQQSYAPPMLTRTWFHQGPMDPRDDGHWEDHDGSSEYWPGDPNLLEHTQRVNTFVRTLPVDAQREALRTLRSSVLRSEVYALDGSAAQDRPYTVTEHAYDLREESAPAVSALRRRIFFPMGVAQRTTQWERGDDPQTQLSYTAGFDEVGQPSRQISMACPRGWRTLTDTPSAGFLATLAHTAYVIDTPADVYLRDRVMRSRSFEVTGTTGRTVRALAELDESSTSLRLIGETLNYYDGSGDAAADFGAFVGLPLGRLGRYGALVRSETLVMTQEHLRAAYGNAVPPYLVPGASFTSGVDYPAEFVASVPALSGYVHHAAAASNSEGYFVVAASRRYDFHRAAGTGRGLVLVQRDPLGHESTINFDAYQLLPRQVTGPTGLVVQAEYNYRVFQAHQVTDPNGNVNEVVYSATGLVTQAWVRGKPGRGEGDVATPSVRVEYGLRAYYESKRADPDNPQPVYARAIRRVFHDSDPDDTGETIETREYSDGFGRVLQTRTQGESMRFGDALFGGGNAVLPVDQSVDSDVPVIGMENVDPGKPNVIVSGWQRHDNKGRVTEKYESFYDIGWEFQPRQDSQLGRCVVMHYDPRGQVIRTVNPDGSEQRVIYGVPFKLEAPPLAPSETDKFRPTPWEAYTYDPNDNAGRTHEGRRPHLAYAHHFNTPASIEIDALGRTVRTVARHRSPALSDGTLPPVEEHITRSSYDIQGNLIGIRDALGRLAFEYVHDLTKNVLRTESLDAGTKRVVLDAAGNPIESRDAKGAVTLRANDALLRPTRLWARDAQGEAVGLREVLSYDLDPNNPGDSADRNLLGKLHTHHDEAGLVRVDRYSFTGNILESSRRVLTDEFMLAAYRAHTGDRWDLLAPRIDWASPPSDALDAQAYRTRSSYDALGRIKWSAYPETRNELGQIERHRLRPAYNRAGALERIELEGPLGQDDRGPRQPYVQHIAYNAKGQRTLILYGNGLMTRYAYDDDTFRLTRMRTERYSQGNAAAFRPSGGLLQELGYVHDLSGNILRITDLTPGSGVQNHPGAAHFPGLQTLLSAGDALVREFAYDPLYRLVSATGRECSNTPVPRPADDSVRCGYNSGNHGTANQDNAPNMTALYMETYEYDLGGNMLRLAHRRYGAGGGGWNRHFGVAGCSPRAWREKVADFLAGNAPDLGSGGNRLTHFGNDEDQIQSHAYDANGNLVHENSERHFEWDHTDRLKIFRNQTDNRKPSIYTLYLYDSGGQRVKKLVITGNDYRTTTYLGAIFEHHAECKLNSQEKYENCSMHVMDGMRRIAIQRVGIAFDGDGAGKHPIQYHLGDHLGTSALVVSGNGAWINREEFFPYGETSLGTFGRKRYRFTGKERDEESGLSYHGHRYYFACLCRWIGADPLGPVDGPNSMLYASDSPLVLHDPTGLAGEPGEKPDYPTKGSASNNLGATNHGANLEADSYVPEKKSLRTEVGFADGKEVKNLSDATRKADTVEGTGKGAAGLEEKGRDTQKWLGDDGKLNKSAVAADARKSADQAADTLKEAGSGLKQMQLRITTWGKGHLAKQKQHIAEWTKAAKDALKAKGAEDVVTVVGQTARDLWKKVKAGRETIVGAMVAKKMLAKEVVEKVATNPKVIKAAAGVTRSASKAIPLLGTAAGLYSFQAEAASGNYASAGVQLVGASEIPILAQVADFGSLAADLAWLAKELLDPEQQVEQWWYETFLK